MAWAAGWVAISPLLWACQEPVSMTRPRTDARPTPTPLPPTPLRAPVDAKPTAQAASGVNVKHGGAVVWAAEADPVDLDPLRAADPGSVAIWGDLTYQSLVMFDEKLKVTPCLAESWTVSDPTRWTFKLREGVKLHDGTTLDAEDVTFWFDRLMAPATASPYRAEYGQITRVQATGRYDVTFTLNAPHAPLLATLASLRGSGIVPRRWVSSAGSATRSSAVGSGPFRIAEYVPNRLVRYVRHAEYWERSLPYLDEITLRIVPDEAERVAALRTGEVSYAALSPEAARRLKSEKELTVLASPGPVQHLTTFNLRRKPFEDVRVRLALALAVDRRVTPDRVLGGDGRLTGPIPASPAGWGMAPEEVPAQRDVKRAKQLLADAGYPDGLDATLRVSADAPIAASLASQMADQLKEAGVRLTVERLPEAALRQAAEGGDFDLLAHSRGFLPDPDAYLTSGYRTQGPQNLSGYQNPAFDDLLDQARGILDPTARRRLYDQAVQILLDDVPSIWWFTQNNTEAIHTRIKGYVQSFTGRRPFLKQTWLDKQ